MSFLSSYKKSFFITLNIAIILAAMTFISAKSPILVKIKISSKNEMMQIIERDILSKIPKNYFLKKKHIQNMLNNYSLKELKAIYQDYFLLKTKTFEKAIKGQSPRQFVATAGGPGSGKSTILEEYLNKNKGYAYIDPDRTCLLHMENTYKKDIENNKTPQYAYTKWRDASNFIANVLICYALEKGYNLAHGTTLTSIYSKFELEAVKNHCYNRKILHISCPTDIRFASEKARRARGIVQCTNEDLLNKGECFFQRLEDYFKNAEEIDFYYRSNMTTSKKVATKTSSNINIFDAESFNIIKNMHNSAMKNKNYWANISR